MRMVVALGGNALLRRGETPTATTQRHNVEAAADALAPIVTRHTVLVSHGNGPQVGLLALQAEAYTPVAPYPLDVLDAESEGMVGYLIERGLASRLPGRSLATLLTMVEVDAGDPAFARPSKPIGPFYDETEVSRIRSERRWTLARDGEHWRRVVPSPSPRRVVELEAIRALLDLGLVVVCAGGGGIPVIRHDDGRLEGVEAVIDKDRVSALLATEIEADLLVLATDVDAVYDGWGRPDRRPLRRVTPSELARLTFDAGSMGPKVSAACDFVAGGEGRRAAIGALGDLQAVCDGQAGTQIV